MTALPLARRYALALTALGMAAAVLHVPIAQTLVTRGDELIAAGDLSGGIAHYARARWFDPAGAAAADRLAFALLQRRTADAARQAEAIATAALRTGSDQRLLVDRGIARGRLANWRGAEDDFARAAAVDGDWRFWHMAGRMAERAGARDRAAAYYRASLAAHPDRSPSRPALARVTP